MCCFLNRKQKCVWVGPALPEPYTKLALGSCTISRAKEWVGGSVVSIS